MAAVDQGGRGARAARSLLVGSLCLISGWLWAGDVHAERSTFRSYGADQGLTTMDGSCLTHDAAGAILVCTEHGVFSYDGRRFVNLGTEQGLPDSGIVYGIQMTATGRIAVQYASELFVSKQPTDPAHPVTSLLFAAADHPGINFYDERTHHLVAWRGGFAFVTGDELVRVTVPAGQPARFESMGYDAEEHALLHHATRVFSVNGGLWETFGDGRVCTAEPGAVRCYGTQDGLVGGPWLDVIADADGRILARSRYSVAALDAATHRWSITTLPDQGGQYKAYTGGLGLFTTPDGRIVTQSARGLDVRGSEGWRELTVADGAPDGPIVGALTDGSGQLWFHVLGRGLVRWVGYGHWITVERSDGLSPGISWQTARSVDGHLWVATDGGVDELAPDGPLVRVSRTYPFGSYALAATPAGEVWTGSEEGVQVIGPETGSASSIAIPVVEAIVPGRDHMVWLGTDNGLYRVDDTSGPPFRPVLVKGWPTPVQSIVLDHDGGVYYLTGGWLHHRHPDGGDVIVNGAGWGSDTEPRELAIARDGSLWVGGPRGLHHLALSGDRIASNRIVPAEDIGSTTVSAVMVDHRGWVWVGTSAGISVYDGRHWVSANADQGLLSNDISEDGIREDPDGSVWIATTSGLSHLRDPASLFVARPLSVMVTGAHLGASRLTAATQPYTRDPLAIELGTPDHGIERSVLFRYRLSDVDKDWVTSSSGAVSYPFVPPGRHMFTVAGYDTLSHTASGMTSYVVDVAYPWWRRWWSEAMWATLIAAAIYGGVHIRFRALYVRQRQLKRLVAQATAKLRDQAAELQHQAMHDKLTGLLNRAEVETRLAARLAQGGNDDLMVALLDVDHFKRINDRHGHLGGDEVLRALGHMISRSTRDGEYAGRYGGEEILLVLADADGHAAERILKLHLAIRHDTFRVTGGLIPVTCSIGVAWAGDGDSWESLIGRADAALYEAKHGGRDRVVENQRQPARVNDGNPGA